MDVLARDEGHQAAYRAVLDFCSGGIQGIGPFEAEELVRLVERAHGVAQLKGAVDAVDALLGALDALNIEAEETDMAEYDEAREVVDRWLAASRGR